MSFTFTSFSCQTGSQKRAVAIHSIVSDFVSCVVKRRTYLITDCSILYSSTNLHQCKLTSRYCLLVLLHCLKNLN
jgi:hypothetical protein